MDKAQEWLTVIFGPDIAIQIVAGFYVLLMIVAGILLLVSFIAAVIFPFWCLWKLAAWIFRRKPRPEDWKDYELTYMDFWADILEDRDGNIDFEKVQMELHKYKRLHDSLADNPDIAAELNERMAQRNALPAPIERKVQL